MCGILLQGCVVGAIIFLLSEGKNSRILRFDEQLFFIYVLPPIIFNAGYVCEYDIVLEIKFLLLGLQVVNTQQEIVLSDFPH